MIFYIDTNIMIFARNLNVDKKKKTVFITDDIPHRNV